MIPNDVVKALPRNSLARFLYDQRRETLLNFSQVLLISHEAVVLASRDLSYKDLAKKLKGSQKDKSERAVLQKLDRGRLSAAFLVAALEAMGIEQVDVSAIMASKPIDLRRKAPRAQETAKNTKKPKKKPIGFQSSVHRKRDSNNEWAEQAIRDSWDPRKFD